MNSKQTQIISLVVLVVVLIVVGLLIGKRTNQMQAPQEPAMTQETDTSGTPLTQDTDTASIEQDFNSTDWTSLDSDMNAQVSGQ